LQQARRVNEANFGYSQEEVGSMRSLGNHILRGVSGVSKDFWSSEQTVVTVQQYFHSCPVTDRVQAASKLVKSLVSRVLNILFSKGSDEDVQEVVLVLFARFDPRSMFPSSDFRKDIQSFILSQLQQIFEDRPVLTASLQKPIMSLLSNASTRNTLGELVLTMIWVVGEYLTPSLASQYISRDMLNDYYDAFEIFVFEQISNVKSVLADLDGGAAYAANAAKQDSEEAFSTRLALVVIGALSKFAARWQFFNSRVVICLSKLASISDYMHPSVGERTFECISLLKYPSIASVVLGKHRPRDAPLTDANSPLPFILEQYQHPPESISTTGAFSSNPVDSSDYRNPSLTSLSQESVQTYVHDAQDILHPYTLARIDKESPQSQATGRQNASSSSTTS